MDLCVHSIGFFLSFSSLLCCGEPSPFFSSWAGSPHLSASPFNECWLLYREHTQIKFGSFLAFFGFLVVFGVLGFI